MCFHYRLTIICYLDGKSKILILILRLRTEQIFFCHFGYDFHANEGKKSKKFLDPPYWT